MESKAKARSVTLYDGRVVLSDSEEWRHECEVRWICRLPSNQKRKDYLYGTLNKYGKMEGGVLQKRGKKATDILYNDVIKYYTIAKL